jgi:UDP-N-acetylmuramate--alanine ligase
MMDGTKKEAHFLGVGGMGMTPLALYLAQAGWSITGEDMHLAEGSRKLLAGAGVCIDEFNTFRSPPERMVISSAIGPDHAMLIRAQEAGARIWRRGAMLSRVIREKKVVAVVGSHGKTTTTAMIIHLMREMGSECGYVLGGLFADSSLPPARYDEANPWVVVEVDESDGTIERFEPYITVALNLDLDHVDQYASLEDLETTMARLFARTRYGVIVPKDSRLEAIAREVNIPEIRTFGPDADYAFTIRDSSRERVSLRTRAPFGQAEVAVKAPGGFNARNAAAALSAVHWILGRAEPGHLETWPGVLRRQQCRFQSSEAACWEDYAHHPTEIKEVISVLAANYPGWQVVAVFQPHRYTRTQALKRELAQSFSGVDRLFLLPVYGASERPLPGGMREDLLEAFKGGELDPVPTEAGPELFAGLRDVQRPKTLFLFIGAGDISEAASAFAAKLRHPGALKTQFIEITRDRLNPDTVLKLNEPLLPKTTIRIGGPAACYAEPVSVADLRVLLRHARLLGLPSFTLGRGSNLIIPDDGFEGLVLRFQHETWKSVGLLEGNRLFAGAGIRLKDLASFTARSGLTGFEFMEGIPGSLGGSLRMNAGAMGSWMFDVVERVLLVQNDGADSRPGQVPLQGGLPQRGGIENGRRLGGDPPQPGP